jgi:hypothetical protein
MTQNRSTAVMQRRVEPHDSLDDFPTPPWATRGFCEHMVNRGWLVPGQSCREPAANRGFMARPLGEFFAKVEAADVHDYGVGYPVSDYLFGPEPAPVDWTITNPPFRLAQQFIERALRTSTIGVAVIVRTAFLESVGRYAELFRDTPPAIILQATERVPMVKGRYDPAATTATAYCWLVWMPGAGPIRPSMFEWIAPCRKRLERASDYSAESAAP